LCTSSPLCACSEISFRHFVYAFFVRLVMSQHCDSDTIFHKMGFVQRSQQDQHFCANHPDTFWVVLPAPQLPASVSCNTTFRWHENYAPCCSLESHQAENCLSKFGCSQDRLPCCGRSRHSIHPSWCYAERRRSNRLPSLPDFTEMAASCYGSMWRCSIDRIGQPKIQNRACRLRVRRSRS